MNQAPIALLPAGAPRTTIGRGLDSPMVTRDSVLRQRLATILVAEDQGPVLQVMQRTGSHLARVVADDGAIIGVVFLEDVIEELVGEIRDAAHT